MWFASQLYEQGIITGDQFAKAVQRQLKSRPVLGKLAVQERLLTLKQVRQVFAAQAENLDKLFGEVAIELGLLSEEDVVGLLEKQAKSAPPLSEILVEMGIFSESEINSHLNQVYGALKQSEDVQQRELAGKTLNFPGFSAYI